MAGQALSAGLDPAARSSGEAEATQTVEVVAQRRLTRERLIELLAAPGPKLPAHDPATQNVPAPAKVQAALGQLAKVQPQVIKAQAADVRKAVKTVAPTARKSYPLIRREVVKRHALEAKSQRQVDVPVTPMVTLAAPRERRDSRTSNPSRAGPDGDPDPSSDSDPAGFPLTLVDRAPFLWRFRALRCRYMEWREGVVA